MMADDVHKAIAVAMEGKMNPEAFKKFMPKSYAALRGNFDRSLSEGLFDRVFKIVQTKMMQHDPSIMTQLLPYQVPDQPEHHFDIKAILILLCHAIGTDAVINGTPYQPRFVKVFRDNIERRCGIFPINEEEGDRDNLMIRDIYYSAYLATAYEFQEEIEMFHTDMKLDQVCIRVHDEGGFIQGLVSELRSCVVEFPSQILTAEDLLQEVEQHYPIELAPSQTRLSSLCVSLKNCLTFTTAYAAGYAEPMTPRAVPRAKLPTFVVENVRRPRGERTTSCCVHTISGP